MFSSPLVAASSRLASALIERRHCEDTLVAAHGAVAELEAAAAGSTDTARPSQELLELELTDAACAYVDADRKVRTAVAEHPGDDR